MITSIKNNVMVDLETMGTGSNAAIVAIGAVFFDETGIGDTFYRKVSLKSSVDHGLVMDADTVLWWMKQSDEARKEIYSSENAFGLDVALNIFRQYIDAHDTDREHNILLWGNSESFDNVILNNAFRACSIESPFNFWDDRCYRTLRDLFPYIDRDSFSGTAHNALDDAVNQAKHAVKILQEIAKINKEHLPY